MGAKEPGDGFGESVESVWGDVFVEFIVDVEFEDHSIVGWMWLIDDLLMKKAMSR